MQLSKDWWSVVCTLVICTTSAFGQDFVWTQTAAPQKQWQFVTSSSDGTKMMASASGLAHEIWISTNSGLTWINGDAPSAVQWWSCGTSSADGTQLVAAGGGLSGRIYASL
jgi:hypothetical protein